MTTPLNRIAAEIENSETPQDVLAAVHAAARELADELMNPTQAADRSEKARRFHKTLTALIERWMLQQLRAGMSPPPPSDPQGRDDAEGK